MRRRQEKEMRGLGDRRPLIIIMHTGKSCKYNDVILIPCFNKDPIISLHVKERIVYTRDLVFIECKGCIVHEFGSL